VGEIHRVVGTGGSFGASPVAQHIGLGHAKEIRLLEVDWPIAGGATQTFRDLPLRQLIEIHEGEPSFKARPLVATPKPVAGSEPHHHD